MKYLQKSFTLPAGSSKITQKAWEKAVGKKPRKLKNDRSTGTKSSSGS